MLYALTGIDIPDSAPGRAAQREAHLDRVRGLQAEGRLVVAGPFPKIDAPDLSAGVSGSLIIAEFASLEEAQAWAAADPYVAAGVWASHEVRPFHMVFPQ